MSSSPPALKRSVRITPQMAVKLDRLALCLGCRPSDVIRQALDLRLDPVRLAAHVAEVIALADVDTAAEDLP